MVGEEVYLIRDSSAGGGLGVSSCRVSCSVKRAIGTGILRSSVIKERGQM